jgi:hypothetical protein
MRRAELALGTRLTWIAVDHWDTDNPHTHIILRGRHEDGRDLVIPREYVSHGFRSAAQDIATERLGPRGRDDARLALEREARAHRPSRLDRMIEGQLDEQGLVRLAHLQAPDRSPEVTDALKARAQELKRLGLATEVGRNIFQFEPEWRDRLKAMELHLDIRKALVRSRTLDLARGVTDPARQMSKALNVCAVRTTRERLREPTRSNGSASFHFRERRHAHDRPCSITAPRFRPLITERSMIPEHVLIVAAALCALWVLFRWGPPLLLLYAVARLWVGEWGEAILAFVFAVLIEHANAYASWLEWNAYGRDAWLRRRRCEHARH